MAYMRNFMGQIGQYDMGLQQSVLNQSLFLIKDSVKGEKEDEEFYDYLISISPTEEEKSIITSIRDDERKHNKMFRQIYKELTGQDIIDTDTDKVEFKKPKSYIDGIKRALFGELAAVEKYRKIRQGLPYIKYRDMLFEIITDEIKHAIKYNYILYLNSMKNKNRIKVQTRMNEKLNEIGTSINKIRGNAVDTVKEKLEEENILEEIVVPGIILGIKNTYILNKDEENTRDNTDIKSDLSDILIKYIAQLVETLLDKIKGKLDLEKIFQQYIIPELVQGQN